jgi:hypothetical protein
MHLEYSHHNQTSGESMTCLAHQIFVFFKRGQFVQYVTALNLNKQTTMNLGLQFIVAGTSTVNCFNFFSFQFYYRHGIIYLCRDD